MNYKLNFTMGIFALLFSTHAFSLNIQCLDAGGYYGRLVMSELPKSYKLSAGAGYAYKLGKGLGLGHEVGQFTLYIAKKNCRKIQSRSGKTVFYCKHKKTPVVFTNYQGKTSRFTALASSFALAKSEGKPGERAVFNTRLAIAKDSQSKASVDYNFGSLGTCSISK